LVIASQEVIHHILDEMVKFVERLEKGTKDRLIGQACILRMEGLTLEL